LSTAPGTSWLTVHSQGGRQVDGHG
jgi:hypothetical protein